MAEIAPWPQIDISKKDTLDFLKYWEKFYKYYQQNDMLQLISLSLDSVVCPVYDKDHKYYQEEKSYVSIKDFLQYPFRAVTNLIFIPISKKEQFDLHIHYEYSKDYPELKFNLDSVLLRYEIVLLSKEVRGRYELLKTHSFSFIKDQGSIKFSGLEINENNSRFRNDPMTISTLHFPLSPKKFDNAPNSLDTFVNLWYSNYLSEFKEPYLYNYRGNDEIYRFTWLRSFHNPVVIRFQKQGNDHDLTTKEMTDYDGYIPNKTIVNSVRCLGNAEWGEWELKINRLNFWQQPTHDPEPRPMDGAEWILEANIKGKYHFTTRTMPDNNYQETCKYLLRLSGLKIPKEQIY